MVSTWKQKGTIACFFCFFYLFCAGIVQAEDYDKDIFNDDLMLNGEEISDPFEPINRVFFVFNDKLYFWVLKPVSQTYALFLPEDIRMCIGNAFRNVMSPVRIVNNLLQGKVADSGTEIARFFINTLAGAGGLGDPAGDIFNLQPKKEDLGQTLGKWGVGDGIYFCWPILGPSNARDTIGFVGDAFLNPLTYLSMSSERAGFAVQAGLKVNSTSLSIGEYEDFKEAAFDPYTAMRDFYHQSRKSKISDQVRMDEGFSGNLAPWGQEGYTESENVAGKSTALMGETLADLNNVEKLLGGSLPQYNDTFDFGTTIGGELLHAGLLPSEKGFVTGLHSQNLSERL